MKHIFSGFNKIIAGGPYLCFTYCDKHFTLDQRHRYTVDRAHAELSNCEECHAVLALDLLACVP
jgi:hypothetical protein